MWVGFHTCPAHRPPLATPREPAVPRSPRARPAPTASQRVIWPPCPLPTRSNETLPRVSTAGPMPAPTAHTDLLAVCARAPHAVVCGESALGAARTDRRHPVRGAHRGTARHTPPGDHLSPDPDVPVRGGHLRLCGSTGSRPLRARTSPFTAPRAIVVTPCASAAPPAGRLGSSAPSTAICADTARSGLADLQGAARDAQRPVRHPSGHRSGACLMSGPSRDTAAGRIYNDLRSLARRTGRPGDQLMLEYVLERFLFRAERPPRAAAGTSCSRAACCSPSSAPGV